MIGFLFCFPFLIVGPFPGCRFTGSGAVFVVDFCDGGETVFKRKIVSVFLTAVLILPILPFGPGAAFAESGAEPPPGDEIETAAEEKIAELKAAVDAEAAVVIENLEDMAESFEENLTSFAAIAGSGFLVGIGDPDEGEGVIEIDTATELAAIGTDVDYPLDGSYVLTDHIDLSTYNNGEWVPIGDNSTWSDESRFTGTFDGQGYVISNLKITGGAYEYNGLFGYTSGATIKNVGLAGTDIDVSWNDTIYAGGISGYADGGSISNCYNTGDVSASFWANAGGICGYAIGDDISISNCYNTGDVSAVSDFYWAYAGGICGYAGGSISNCHNTGDVSASASSYSSAYAGGICGFAYGGSISISISDCYNTGAVSAVSDSSSARAGGICGIANSDGISISDCYNTGAVSAVSDSSSGIAYAGGICGYASGSISNCYNTGDVSAVSDSSSAYAGGICGSASTGTISNCVALSGKIEALGSGTNRSCLIAYTANGTNAATKSGNLAISGDITGNPIDDTGDGSGGARISEAEAKLQATYANLGWDFNTTWKMVPGYALPQLQWQTAYTSWNGAEEESGNVISGLITDSQGRPVQNAVVTARTATRVFAALSGADGVYTFKAAEGAGEAVITASHAQSGYGEISGISLDEPSSGNDITLAENTTVVTVLDRTGAPIPNASVSVDSATGGRTGADGLLTLRNLRPGAKTLQAWANGYISGTGVPVTVAEGTNAFTLTLTYDPQSDYVFGLRLSDDELTSDGFVTVTPFLEYAGSGTPVAGSAVINLPAGLAPAEGAANPYSGGYAVVWDGKNAVFPALTLYLAGSAANLDSYSVSAAFNGGDIQKNAGAAVTVVNSTLNAPPIVQMGTEFDVYGTARAGSEVRLILDGKDVEQSFNSGTRYFGGKLKIAEAGRHELVAHSSKNGVDSYSPPVLIDVTEGPPPAVTGVGFTEGYLGGTLNPNNAKYGLATVTTWVLRDAAGWYAGIYKIAGGFSLENGEGYTVKRVSFADASHENPTLSGGKYLFAFEKGAWGGVGVKPVVVTLGKGDAEYDFVIALVTINIDPSGYVYDKSTGERIPGATVTLQVKENGQWKAWDDPDGLQTNPMTSDAEGRFGWMVPVGEYRVLAGKAGYSDATANGKDVNGLADGSFDAAHPNDGFPVPPEQTQVNIPLTSTAKPDDNNNNNNNNNNSSGNNSGGGGGGSAGTTTPANTEENKTDEENPVPAPDGQTGQGTTPQFSDTAGHWAGEAIAFVVSKGLFNGVSSTEFAPDAQMTRAMFATVLFRYADGAANGTASFGDVPAGKWYTDGVLWAAENGIASGVGGGNFNPDGNITREQLAVMLYNYAKQSGLDISGSADLEEFGDKAALSAWAEEAVKWAAASGLINGKPGNLLDPKGFATRAEVATILQRFIENL
jgi:hypothetical protein